MKGHGSRDRPVWARNPGHIKASEKPGNLTPELLQNLDKGVVVVAGLLEVKQSGRGAVGSVAHAAASRPSSS